MNSEKDVKAITEAEKTGTFMVIAGMDCCPPSVVEDAIAQVEGAGKTAIKVNGSTAEVTVSFDDTKTNLDAIKTEVSDLGLPSNKRRIFYHEKYRVNVQGMTCSGCEQHVAVALENMGAKAIEVDFRRGEAVFELPDDVKVEDAKMRLLTQTITRAKQKNFNRNKRRIY